MRLGDRDIKGQADGTRAVQQNGGSSVRCAARYFRKSILKDNLRVKVRSQMGEISGMPQGETQAYRG